MCVCLVRKPHKVHAKLAQCQHNIHASLLLAVCARVVLCMNGCVNDNIMVGFSGLKDCTILAR